MALEIALVMKGDASEAKQAVGEVDRAIDGLESTATEAGSAVEGVAEAVGEVGEKAPAAAQGVEEIGNSADTAGGKLGSFGRLAVSAIGGFAASIVASGVQAALGAITNAAVTYFNEVTNSASNIADDLDRHGVLVDAIRGKWTEAEGAASNYGAVSSASIAFDAEQNFTRLTDDFRSAGRRFLNPSIDPFGLVPGARPEDGPGGGAFKAYFDELRRDYQDGVADFIAFRDRVAAEASKYALGSPEREFGATTLAQLGELGDKNSLVALQAEWQRAGEVLQGLAGYSSAAARALGGFTEDYAGAIEPVSSSLPVLREAVRLMGQLGATPSPAMPTHATGGGFASGGYTGHLPTDQIAGFVHGQEYVFDAAAVRSIGVENLEAIRRGVRGYATGGTVGGSTSSGRAPWEYGLGGVLDDVKSGLSGLGPLLQQFTRDVMETHDPLQAAINGLGGLAQGLLGSVANGAFNAAGEGLGELLNMGIKAIFNGGFAQGGYTGHAPADRIAGVVHGQEFVFDAQSTRAIGVDNLEAMRRGVRGFADGGFVRGSSIGSPGLAPPQSLTINVNVAGARGNKEIEAMVARGVGQGLAAFDRVLPMRVSDYKRRGAIW